MATTHLSGDYEITPTIAAVFIPEHWAKKAQLASRKGQVLAGRVFGGQGFHLDKLSGTLTHLSAKALALDQFLETVGQALYVLGREEESSDSVVYQLSGPRYVAHYCW